MMIRISNRSQIGPMSPRARTRGHSGGGGFTLVELIGTMILLGALMSMTVPLLRGVNAQRRAADARQLAMQEAANAMERFSAGDWNDVTQSAADSVRLSADTKAALRDASLTVKVTSIASQPAAKRIRIELRWKNREGDFVSPVGLTSFVYRNGGSK